MDNALKDAFDELDAATNEHAEAEREMRAAASRENSARNRVNAAQKKIDALLAEMKKGAHRDSEWKRAERESRMVRCAG